MDVAFQLGIDSASPTITYAPSSPNVIAQDATSGWTPYYTNSGFPSALGGVGQGSRLQISSKNSSFFSITWFGASPFPLSRKFFALVTSDRLTPHPGTGIDLYGNATLAAFEVSLDRKSGGSSSGNVLVNPGSNLLASFSELLLDTYTVTLTANTSSSPSSFIAFERAVITSAVGVANLNEYVNAKKFATANYSFPVSLTVLSETVDDDTIAYEGLWSTLQGSVIDPGRQFHATEQLGDKAQLTFNGKRRLSIPPRMLLLMLVE